MGLKTDDDDGRTKGKHEAVEGRIVFKRMSTHGDGDEIVCVCACAAEEGENGWILSLFPLFFGRLSQIAIVYIL